MRLFSRKDEDFLPVDTYIGETKDGKRHGHGKLKYPNGDVYEGEWRKSTKYGYGVCTSSNGTR